MWWRRTLLPSLESLKSPHKLPWLPSSALSYSSKKGKIAPLQERKMVDRFRLWAKGGDGGNGCWSFRRSRHDRRGSPDGGNGGKGGDVILECSAAVWDLSNLQHHLNAGRGGHGVSKNMIGSRGADKVVQVPVGTVVHLVHGEMPSFVESRSTTSLNPWDIPDDDDINPSQSRDHVNAEVKPSHSCQHANTSNPTTADKKLDVCERQDLGKSSDSAMRKMSSSTWHTMPGSSPGTTNRSSRHNEIVYTVPTEDFMSTSEEGESDYEDMGSDADFSEMELEEEEHVQYGVAELTEPGKRLVIARGGEGGLGNASLGKVSKSHNYVKHQAAASDDENLVGEDQSSLAAGLPGSQPILILELKSIADVGLVGMPNAGKSTLLGAISRAKPVVGHYAFTTLRPNIGNLNYDDFFSVTVADIPGLIKGAHENRGLGHAFLRHIERTKVLAYVVDLSAALYERNGLPPWEQLRDLVLELEYHQAGLSDRPSLVVANKIDEEGTDDIYEELKRRVQGVPIYPICAILEEGIPELKAGLRRLVDGTESWKLDVDRIIID